MKQLRIDVAFAMTLLLMAAIPSGAGAQSSGPARFTGEVRHGEVFEKPFGAGLIFRLTPGSDPATPGWRIEIYSAHTNFPRGELSWVVTPPYRGNNPRYLLVSYGQSAKEVVAHTPRQFLFVTTLLDHFRADVAVGKLLWPGSIPERQLEAARQQLNAIPKGDGSFNITGFRLAGEEGGRPGRIAWLKFEAELSMPVGKPPLPVSAHGIREAPLEDALAEAFLADVSASDKCPEDRAPAEIGTRSFGDLDGDGIEEAALTGHSCLAGSGGPDLFLVLKLLPTGELARVSIPLPEGGDRGAGSWRRSRGYMSLNIEGGKLIEVFEVYRADDPQCCPSGGKRKQVFEWDGNKFVRKGMSEK